MLKLLLDGDPACEANAAPLVEWATAAWAAATPSYGTTGAHEGPLATDADQARCHSGVPNGESLAVGAVEAPRCAAAGAGGRISAPDADLARGLGVFGREEPSAVGAVSAPRCGNSRGMGGADERHAIGAVQLNAAIKFANDDTADGSWEGVRGPASAAVLTAKRLGWRFRDGTMVMD